MLDAHGRGRDDTRVAVAGAGAHSHILAANSDSGELMPATPCPRLHSKAPIEEETRQCFTVLGEAQMSITPTKSHYIWLKQQKGGQNKAIQNPLWKSPTLAAITTQIISYNRSVYHRKCNVLFLCAKVPI